MLLSKFESMLKTNAVYFFDATEFQHIIEYYLEVGKHSLAKKALQLGMEQHPESMLIKLLQVELLIFEDKLTKASEVLLEIESVEPYNEEIFIKKAIISSKKGHHKDAIEKLKSGLTYAEDPSDIWSMIGMEYLYIDDYKNARINFIRCVEIDCNDHSALYNIIYCFEMEEKQEEAIQYLKKYIDINPYCEIAWHQLGQQYFTLTKFKDAVKAFDYAVLIDDSFIGGYLEKAKTLEELQRYEEAIENYLITLELDDPTAYVYIRIGQCFEKLLNIDTAIQYYKKATHEDPLLEKSWVLLSDIYFQKKDYQKSLYYIGKVLQIDEANPDYWRKYADINLKINFYEETITALKKCIDLEDTSLDIYITLADVTFFIGAFEEALQILIKAKQTYKEFAEIEYRLCGIFMILNKEDYSLTHLKNALAIDFQYKTIIEQLYPTVFKNSKIQKLISNHQF